MGNTGFLMPRPGISGLILAGGQGQRMGGVDKGLQLLDGRPLIAHSIERLCPQVDSLLINANRHPETYAAFGHPLVADTLAGYPGPLAGLLAGLAASRHDLLVSVPCDSPFFPADLVARLYAGLSAGQADIAVAQTGDQMHPVFCLCHTRVRPSLEDFLQRGERKFGFWLKSQKHTVVRFDEQPEAFMNINTREELAAQQTTR